MTEHEDLHVTYIVGLNFMSHWYAERKKPIAEGVQQQGN